MNKIARKIGVAVIALVTIVSVSGITPVVAQTPAEALQVQINTLLAQIATLQGQLGGGVTTPAPAPAFNFTRNLTVGSTGEDVRALQQFLNARGFTVAATGPGSIGNESTRFGPRTQAALARFQSANNVSPARGFFGPLTRARIATVTPTPTPTPTPIVTVPTIRLAANTPASATLPQGAQMVPVLRFTLTAGTEVMTVSEMRFRRAGLGHLTDWPSLHLFEGDIRLTDFGRNILADTQEVTFPGLNISIPAGQTRTYTLRTNVASAGTGNQGAFELVNVASNISLTGLPIRGNTMTIGGIPVSAITLQRGLSLTNPMVGTQDATIASFRIQSGANAVALEQVAVTIGGTIRRGDVTNLELYHDNTLLARTSALNAQDKAVFVLSPMFEIGRDLSRTLTVRADLSGRVGETILASITTPEDVIIIDQVLGFGTGATLTDVNEPGEIGNITLQGGRLTLVDLGPATADVAVRSSDVELIRVGLTADRNLEVRPGGIVLNLDGTALANTITDLRLRDAVTGATLMTGVITGDAAAIDGISANNAILLSGSFTLTPGVTRNLIVSVDIGAVATDLTIEADRLTIVPANVRDLATGAALVPADIVPAFVTGETMTIRTAGLTAGLMGHPISTTVVTGAPNVPAVGVSLAAVGTDVTVRSLEARVFVNTANTFADGTSPTPVVPANTVVTSARLMDGATVLGTGVLSNIVDAAHDYGRVTFTGLNLRIARGTTRNLTVQISTASGLAAPSRFVAVSVLGTTANAIDAVDAEGRTVAVGAGSDVNLVTFGTSPTRFITVASTGTLAAAISAATPIAAIVPVGTTGRADVAVTTVRYTATNEPIILQDITVTPVGARTALTSVKIIDGARTISMPVPSTGNIIFTDVNIEIPATGHRDIVFMADLAGIGHGSASGDSVELDVNVTRARGKDSNAVVAGGGNVAGGNILTVRQTVPTVAKLTNSTTLTGANDEVLRFTVTANSLGDVELRNLTVAFNRAVTGARLFEGATLISTGTGTGTTSVLFDVVPDPERNIAAGATRTFTVRADSGAVTTALFASILADATGIVWGDGSGVVDINGVLVSGLPITGDTLRL